jgi:hypothetical protein
LAPTVGNAATEFCYPGGILQVFHRQDQQILRLPTATSNQIASNQGKIPSGGHHTSLDDHIQLWRVHHIWPFRQIRSKQGKKGKKQRVAVGSGQDPASSRCQTVSRKFGEKASRDSTRSSEAVYGRSLKKIS